MPFVCGRIPTNSRCITTFKIHMAEQFRLTKVGLVMLGIADLEKSVAFYRDQLGMKRHDADAKLEIKPQTAKPGNDG